MATATETVRKATQGQILDIAATLIVGIPELTFKDAQKLIGMKGKLTAGGKELIERLLSNGASVPKTQKVNDQNQSKAAAPLVPTDEGTTPWLADKAGIVEWIRRKNCGGKEIKIISGLEAIRISSPQDFLAETLNVHRPDDANDWLPLEEKLTRAVEAKSDFGWREFIFCCENWQEIHPSWWSHWQYFAMAIVEIDGLRRVAMLSPSGHGCSVGFGLIGNESGDGRRFPVLASPRS